MIVTFSELFKAYIKCRKNKANTINAIRFQINLISNLWELYYEINLKTYAPKSYICFLVQSPKLREVFASDFRDRIVHHLLVDDLEYFFEKIFIHDSYSCRKNKGTHKAVKRVQSFLNKEGSIYYMQLDIKNFFLSIDKTILYNRIKEIVVKKADSNQERILFLSKKIIFDTPAEKFTFKGDFSLHQKVPKHKSLLYTPIDKGLPIGNLTSQFFANIYLDMLDNFIKRELKVKKYVRYVDDFIIIGSSKEILLKQKTSIEKFLTNKLMLNLREDYKIKKVYTGIDFLGYIINKKYMLVRKRVVNNFKFKRINFLNSKFKENNLCSFKDAKHFKELNASYYGHFKWANSYKLVQKYEMENWL